LSTLEGRVLSIAWKNKKQLLRRRNEGDKLGKKDGKELDEKEEFGSCAAPV